MIVNYGRQLLITLSVTACFLTSNITQAALINFTDKASYLAAAYSIDTITFSEISNGSALNNQYQSAGVTFNGSHATLIHSNFIDNFGANGVSPLELVFSNPVSHLAADFANGLTIEVFNGAISLGTSQGFGASSGFGHFGGVLSDTAFNRAVFTNHTISSNIALDDLHFGATPEPASAALLVASLFVVAGRARIRQYQPR